MLLSAASDSNSAQRLLGDRSVNNFELGRLVVLRGLGSRQDVLLLVNVPEEEVLQDSQWVVGVGKNRG